MNDNTGAVVVGVDGSDTALDAARWASAVAARYGTSLHIVHAMPNAGPNLTDAAAAVRAAMMSYHRDYSEIIVRRAKEVVRSHQPDLEVTTLSTDIPIDEIMVQSSTSARMIVLGCSEVTTAGALLFGSTTLAIATHASCPVVAWRGPATAPTDAPIVVGLDESHPPADVLDIAFEFAERFDVKLAAVRSWSMQRPAAAVTIPFLVDWDALEAAEWAKLTSDVDRYHAKHRSVDVTCFIETGKPAAALLHQVALDGAQLVVVGSRGRNALTSAVLGSTALDLLHQSAVPVMVCRSAQRAATPMCEL